MKPADAKPQRKRYSKPELREYGDLRRLTETNVGGGGSVDGGTYGMTLLKTGG